jgi:hypothetical protein
MVGRNFLKHIHFLFCSGVQARYALFFAQAGKRTTRLFYHRAASRLRCFIFVWGTRPPACGHGALNKALPLVGMVHLV